MIAPSIKLNYNDSDISIFWDCGTSFQYPTVNLYWSLNADMSGEVLVASHIINNPDTFYSTKYAFFRFKRSSIGLQNSSTFYLRLKGVGINGIEDSLNPGEIRLISSVNDAPGAYNSIMLQGYDYENDLWRNVKVSPDGSIGVTGGGGGGGGQGATGLQGQQGVTGLPGGSLATGIQGMTGLPGSTGATGIQGVTGLSGTSGTTGLIGATGFQGITGLIGSTGAIGIQGATGVFSINGTPNTYLRINSTGDGVTGALISESNSVVNVASNTFVYGNTYSAGNTWISRDVALIGWESICYGNGMFVAISADGTNRVIRSYDGVLWTETSVTQSQWFGVCFGKGLFVAIAYTGQVMTSSDGITWTLRTAAATVQWRSVCYGEGLFVAVADNNGTSSAMTSPDGIHWTLQTTPSASWVNVCYGNGMFVAVAWASSNVMTSPEGITWTLRTAAASSDWRYICYGKGLFVAVAYGGTYRLMTSPDGITWTLRTPPEVSAWRSVCYGEGLFVAVSETTGSRIMVSEDGITWTSRRAPYEYSWSTICYGDGLFVAASRSGDHRIMTSGFKRTILDTTNNSGIVEPLYDMYNRTIGNTWLSKDIPPNTNTVECISYGNGMFVIVCFDNGSYRVFRSYDGVSWIGVAAVAGQWSNVTYGNGLFVATSYDGKVMISTDGITWTLGTSAANYNWRSVCYGKNLFVAVASNNNSTPIMTSYDGINWTLRTSTAAYNWHSVCYGNGLFVAVSLNGNVMTSTDGITWSPQTAAASSGWRYVCYGKGLFVAVAYGGTDRLMTSPDGITWTLRTPPEVSAWRSVCYGEGLFVAVSESTGTNRIMISEDGITWTSKKAPYEYKWAAVCYGDGIFVAGSADGAHRIMVSGSKRTVLNDTNDHTHKVFNNDLTLRGNLFLTGNLAITGSITGLGNLLGGTTGSQGVTGLSGVGETGLQGVTGLQGTDGLTGLQGVTGISGAETADVLPLGASYSGGIFAWETATMTSDALDDTNKLLLAIAPSPPNPLSGTLTLSNTVKYNAILPTGLNSAWYQDGKVAGNTISDYVIDGTYNLASPNTSTDFKVGSTFGGDEGAIQHVEDGSVVASRDVTNGAGVTDSIEIITIVTHNTIWRRANARINYTQTTEGYKNHVMRYLSASVDQTTSATKIWFDDQDPAPTFSTGASIVQNNLSSSRYLSGVRYYSTGDTFDITCVVSNIANKAIRPTDPISYIMTGINAVNVAINGSSFAYNADYTMNVSGVAINASNAYSINATVSITARKPATKTATSSSSSQNRLVNTYSSTYSTNGNIYMLDETYRWTLATDFSAIPGNPTNPTGNWNSSTALTNGNAILYNSVWDYPAINFTSGYLPAQSGNDYSAFSGDQVAVWAAYIGLSHSSMSIVFTGIAYTAISAVGTGNLNIELRLPSESDWLDTGKAFGDGNGCRLGSSSGSTLNVSFGVLTSTNSSGVVFIRVTLKNTSAGKASRMQISGT